MKAIVCRKYGPPAILRVEQVPVPVPQAGEVLVKVQTTAINDYDWSLVRGKPYLYRLLFGFSKPKRPVPGMEMAGMVESVGPEVTDFRVGDAVYGDLSESYFGAFAEYVVTKPSALTHRPTSMSAEEAVTIPHAAALAMQGLFDVGGLRQGQNILINGAGGGVGSFALQLAKMHGATVTGVDTGDKLETMKQLGFDRVIDYKKTDFVRTGDRYDLILDTKTTRSPWAHARALTKGGSYVTVGGTPGRLLQIAVQSSWVRWLTGKRIRIVPLKPNKDLDRFNNLWEAGNITCVIDGPYSFEEIPRLIQYFGDGKHTGKVVVRVVDGGNG